MKRRSKIIIGISSVVVILFIGIFVSSFFGGSLNEKSEDGSSVAPGMPEALAEEPSYGEGTPDYTGRPTGGAGDKIIGTYSLNFETLTFPETVKAVDELVAQFKGYIEYSEVYNQPSMEGKIFKYARYTIRIPKNDVSAFNTALKNTAHIISENSNLQNVTRYYNDTTARLESLEAQRKRLNELYEEADRMEDIINIESRLQDIMYQIESLKGEINYLNEAISYSTVSVYVQEVAKLTTGESIQATLSERLGKALKDSLAFFEESLVTFAIAVIYILPFLAVLSVLVFIAVKVRKKRTPAKGKEAPGPSSKE